MRPFQFIIPAVVILLIGCRNPHVPVIKSESFSESQVTLDASITHRLLPDSVALSAEKIDEKLSALNQLFEEFRQNPSESLWNKFQTRWEDFRIQKQNSGLVETNQTMQKWAKLNGEFLKFTGETRFAEVLETMLHRGTQPVLSEKLTKSVIYTHVFDQVYINLLASSSVTFRHTTGGNVRLIQQYDPSQNEMILKCECNDTRFLDVFIRIPSNAVKPAVTHGNVKYVALPGQYCEIARKWKNGDEIRVALKN
jgi:hypothetical protein